MKIGSIRKTSSFRHVVAEGRRARSGSLQISFLEEPASDTLRIGVTVPKRLAKRATKRNYIKRIVKAFFHKNKGVLRRPGRLAILLTAPVGELSRTEISSAISNDLEKILKKSGILAA